MEHYSVRQSHETSNSNGGSQWCLTHEGEDDDVTEDDNDDDDDDDDDNDDDKYTNTSSNPGIL
jgi:hypothetical protein